MPTRRSPALAQHGDPQPHRDQRIDHGQAAHHDSGGARRVRLLHRPAADDQRERDPDRGQPHTDVVEVVHTRRQVQGDQSHQRRHQPERRRTRGGEPRAAQPSRPADGPQRQAAGQRSRAQRGRDDIDEARRGRRPEPDVGQQHEPHHRPEAHRSGHPHHRGRPDPGARRRENDREGHRQNADRLDDGHRREHQRTRVQHGGEGGERHPADPQARPHQAPELGPADGATERGPTLTTQTTSATATFCATAAIANITAASRAIPAATPTAMARPRFSMSPARRAACTVAAGGAAPAPSDQIR